MGKYKEETRQFRNLAVDDEQNRMLKEMWRLNEKLINKLSLEPDEVKYYNLNLGHVIAYYRNNSTYWLNQTIIK